MFSKDSCKSIPSAVSYYVCDMRISYGRSTILFIECFASIIRPDCVCIMQAAGTMDSSGNVFISEVFSEVMVVISAFSTVLFGVSYLISRTASWSQERFQRKNNRISIFVKAGSRVYVGDIGKRFYISNLLRRTVGWRENIYV